MKTADTIIQIKEPFKNPPPFEKEEGGGVYLFIVNRHVIN